MEENQAIERVFRAFVEGSLVDYNLDAVMELFTEDLMGIGMGAQGIVRCREDVRPILSNNKSEIEGLKTTVSYSNMQVRCYEHGYGSICAVLEVSAEKGGESPVSRIGQCASLRKVDGEWKIYMLQATPLSVKASELEAYPLSFAEAELEKYRLEEQLSEFMRENMMAVYKINFSADTFEQFFSRDELALSVKKGEKYEKAIFQAAKVMLDSEDRRRFMETFSPDNIRNSFQDGKQELSLDYEALRPGGIRVWLRSIVRYFMDKDGQLKGYLYLIDIDRQKRSELEILHRAETDSMTGLYDKETTGRKINAILLDSPSRRAGALFMIDLDHFKLINDTFGHGEGDRVIRETAAVLKGTSRKTDVAGRLGGDEFGVFYEGSFTEEVLSAKAEKICDMVRRIHPAEGDGPFCSCSIGIAVCSGETSFEELYGKADKALYVRKKEQGRNGFTFYKG